MRRRDLAGAQHAVLNVRGGRQVALRQFGGAHLERPKLRGARATAGVFGDLSAEHGLPDPGSRRDDDQVGREQPQRLRLQTRPGERHGRIFAPTSGLDLVHGLFDGCRDGRVPLSAAALRQVDEPLQGLRLGRRDVVFRGRGQFGYRVPDVAQLAPTRQIEHARDGVLNHGLLVEVVRNQRETGDFLLLRGETSRRFQVARDGAGGEQFSGRRAPLYLAPQNAVQRQGEVLRSDPFAQLERAVGAAHGGRDQAALSA